jgi:hypothetical protein
MDEILGTHRLPAQRTDGRRGVWDTQEGVHTITVHAADCACVGLHDQ